MKITYQSPDRLAFQKVNDKAHALRRANVELMHALNEAALVVGVDHPQCTALMCLRYAVIDYVRPNILSAQNMSDALVDAVAPGGSYVPPGAGDL